MPGFGRPTLHRPEYNEQAHDHCLLGATNAELAELFALSPRTIDSWIASLYERAVGFRLTVEHTVLHRGEERKLTNTVHYPPDTQACIFWLRNRRRQDWAVRPAAMPPDIGAPTVTMLAELDAAGERAHQGGD